MRLRRSYYYAAAVVATAALQSTWFCCWGFSSSSQRMKKNNSGARLHFKTNSAGVKRSSDPLSVFNFRNDGNRRHRRQVTLHAAARTARAAAALKNGIPTPTKTTTALAGEISPLLSKILGNHSSRKAIRVALVSAVDLSEFVGLVMLAWASVPLASRLHYAYSGQNNFENTRLSTVVKDLSQAAKFGVLLYAVDCLAIILNAMGFQFLERIGVSAKASKICVAVWVALRLKRFKRWMLQKAFRDQTGGESTVKVYDHVLNVLLYAFTFAAIVDRLHLKIGATLSSLFAVGGAGTLVASLASRDLATQVVSGLSVKASVPFLVGDTVLLGDGTSGTVTKIGLLYTEIRGTNEVIMRIPNPQISNQRVSNLSRIHTCQVKQTLWFKYEDIDKMTQVVNGITEEIIASCPNLIKDGSRPFQVSWSSYKEDHLEVTVDCRFRLPPMGRVYHRNRQNVLLAIARAVEQQGVEFAIPSYVAKNINIAVPQDVGVPPFNDMGQQQLNEGVEAESVIPNVPNPPLSAGESASPNNYLGFIPPFDAGAPNGNPF